MYIRQESFLSFEEIIKFQPGTRLRMTLEQLDFTNLVQKLSKPENKRGAKGYEPMKFLNSMVAMQVGRIQFVSGLVYRLNTDPVFRYNCGFNVLESPPSEASFSRFQSKFCQSDDLQKDFEALIIMVKELNVVDGSEVAIDSTKIEAYEKPKPKSKIINDGQSPNWGNKKDTDGDDVKWFG